MGRMVFVLLLAAVVWLGYERFFGAADAAARPEVADPSVQLEKLHAPAAEPEKTARPVASRPEDVFLAALTAGDASARAVAMQRLVAWNGADRGRLAATILDGVREADVDTRLSWLGRTNAFLQSEEGRAVAAEIRDRAHAVTPAEGLSISTKLLARCMSGSLAPGTAKAKAFIDSTYEKHRRLVRRVVFDPANGERARRYKVRSGDSLERIAREMRRTHGLQVEAGTLQAVNRISNPRALQVGQVLRVPIDPIRTEIDKSSFLAAVYVGDEIVRLYWVAHGKDGHDTPVTEFKIGEKLAKPDWHFDGRVIPYGHPDNRLGTHFIKFAHESYTGFGIHGTWKPETIGSRASLGCIRLSNDDIAEYFRLVPRGTSVSIRETL